MTMLLQDVELARRGPSGVQIRFEPMRLRWEWDGLIAADGHAVRLTYDASVRPLDAPTERAMLEESLLRGRPAATSYDVITHFTPALRSAASKCIAELTAAAALQEQSRPAIVDRLTQAARAVAFSSGLEIQNPIAIELDCPALRQEQAAALEARRAEERAARQITQLRRSAELVREFQSLRKSSSDLTAGQILANFSQTDQADMLAAMLAAEAGAHPASLWFVAGQALWRLVDGALPSTPAIALPDTLGPLRSVTPAVVDARPALLVGASRGVWVAGLDAQASPVPFEMPGINSPMGFNSAQIAAGKLWASHSQAGLVAWEMNQPHAPAIVYADLSELQAPRRLHVRDDRLIFTAGPNVCAIGPDGAVRKTPLEPADAVSPLLGLVAIDDGWMLVAADGSVSRLDPVSFAPSGRAQRRCSAVTAAARLPWLDSSRLLLATEDGPVWCVGRDDAVVTQYISPYRGLRLLAAAAHRVAAVTNDRQRLVQWAAWDGTKPISDIHIASIARHRIADIAFVPDRA